MVMDASPTPQCVGREFVRQYYTLLNKAPGHLHRFYNNSSSFVHGGLDSESRETHPAIGQKQIHQKIQALNFCDCHAKINQVDSQSTLGNGVVVQVSGELSNAGQPMRRFTQTFVLAAQSPKKYYVHNDIFRYQDFGFSEDEEEDIEGVEGNVNETAEREVEEGGRSEPEEDQVQQMTVTNSEPHGQPQQQQPPPMTQQMYYTITPQPTVHPAMQPVTINGLVHEETCVIPQPAQQPPQLQPQAPFIPEPTSPEQFSQESEHESVTEQQSPQQIKDESTSSTEEVHEPSESDNFIPTAPEVEEQQVISQNTNNSGLKTYANSVKSYPGTTGATSPQAPKLPLSPPPISNLRLDDRSSMNPAPSAPAVPSSVGVTSNDPKCPRVGVVPPMQQGNQQQQQPPQQQYQPRMQRPLQRDGDRRGRVNQYSDANQLFLGNLPHNVTETELKLMFETRFGRVADLRIHSKQNDRIKGPQGPNNAGRVPNYGFITFEDTTVASKVLHGPAIYYPEENGQKLNIEEKKVKPREGGGRPSTDGRDNIRPMGSQQQQPLRGPGSGGMMRGGHQGNRGGRGGSFTRSDGGRGGGGLRQQPGNPNTQQPYQSRR